MADQLSVCGPLWSSWHFRFVPRRSKHIRISLEPWSGAPEERLCGIVHRRAALLLALRGFALASGTFRLNLAMGFLDVVPPQASTSTVRPSRRIKKLWMVMIRIPLVAS